jgi:hypothetical protein
MIIALSGKKQSGKNTVASIIQYLTSTFKKGDEIQLVRKHIPYSVWVTQTIGYTQWEQRALANPLKQIMSILTGISVQDMEVESIKQSELNEEWWYWNVFKTSQRVAYIGNEEFDKIDFFVKLIKPTLREALQELGTDLLRNQFHPNTHLNCFFKDYREAPTENSTTKWEESKWIATDTRFLNELTALKEKGAITIRVNRPMAKTLPNQAHLHPSETALDHITNWDFIIDNDKSIDEVIIKVENILKKLNLL